MGKVIDPKNRNHNQKSLGDAPDVPVAKGEPFVSSTVIADKYNITKSQLHRRWIPNGVPYYRPSRDYLFRESEVEHWVQEQRKQGKSVNPNRKDGSNENN